MKNNNIIRITGVLLIALMTSTLLMGCGKTIEEETVSSTVTNQIQETQTVESLLENSSGDALELAVTFGDTLDSGVFTMHLYEDNETAVAISRYVGSSGWRLPIYENDDDVDYGVMQYYDMPNRYDIPSNPSTITSEKAGEVYYSHPNRIVLFYQDAEVAGDFTAIGYFDPTEEFVTAVENNPTLEGWGNKIVHIDRP